jgi:hypothetical protein
MTFSLAKWYLDCVTDDGTAVIGYSARLRWGPLRTGYAAILVSPPSGHPTFTSTTRATSAPALDPAGTQLDWQVPRLKVEGCWQRDAEPIGATLLDGIDWRSPMPRAQVELTIAGRRHCGLGYVDHLDLRVPPHRLPFHRLRWGRHLSPSHHAVWIAWADGLERQWGWCDGRRQSHPRVADTAVTCDDHSELRLPSGRELVDRPVRTLLRPMHALLRLTLARTVGAMRDHKRVTRSAMHDPGGTMLDHGWTIDEEVTW